MCTLGAQVAGWGSRLDARVLRVFCADDVWWQGLRASIVYHAGDCVFVVQLSSTASVRFIGERLIECVSCSVREFFVSPDAAKAWILAHGDTHTGCVFRE
jgi:hypothetical protein